VERIIALAELDATLAVATAASTVTAIRASLRKPAVRPVPMLDIALSR
jgi:hypothetical protein